MKISSTLFTVSILFDNSQVLKAIAVSPPDIFLDTNKTETAQLAGRGNKMAAFTHNPYRTLSNVGTWGEKEEGRHFDNKFSTLRLF